MSSVPPIVFAVLAGDLDLVKQRIAAGAPLNHVETRHSTALNQALMRDRKDIAEVLLASGADPEGADLEGNRPRDFAYSPDLKAILFRFGVKDLVPDEWTFTHRLMHFGQRRLSEAEVLKLIEVSLKESRLAHGTITPHNKGGYLVRVSGMMDQHEMFVSRMAEQDIRFAFL